MANIWLIDHYVTTPATGIGGRHFQMARALSKRGHKVTVIAARKHHMLREGTTLSELPDVEHFDGFDFVRIDVPTYSGAHDKRRILAWIGFALGLWRSRKKINPQPDVILYTWPQPIGFIAAERIARSFRARLVLEVRDIWPLSLTEIGGFSTRHPAIMFFQWLEDRAYRISDHVVSNIPRAHVHMEGRGMESHKFTWVSNGIALDFVENPEPLHESFASRIPKSGLRVVYTGTLGEANGLDTLLEAAALVRHLPVSFLIVGQGHTRASLEAKKTELSLTNVLFLGPVPKAQVQSILAMCDVAYIGLRPDPLFRFGVSPNKLFDYLASGKPILYAIDSGEFRPVEQYDAGIQVPPGSADAVADAIRRFLDMSVEERIRIGQNGRKAAVCNFDYDKLAIRLEAALLGSSINKELTES